MHLLVLGLALAPACAAQSGAGATAGQKPAVMQSPSPPPSTPASSEQPSAPVPAPETQPPRPDDQEGVALENRIQTTLGKEPTLSHDSVRVAVSGDAIELTGSVATSRERLTAIRIAQSYAGSKRVVSRITVGTNPQESITPEKKNVTESQRQLHR
jgi:hypothetical protein